VGALLRAPRSLRPGVLASLTLATLVEAFAAVDAGVETGALGLSARALLPSVVELLGAVLSGGVAGEEGSTARFAPGDLWSS